MDNISALIERLTKRGKRMGLWDAVSIVRAAEVAAVRDKDWAALNALRRVNETLVEARDSYVEKD